MTVHKVSRVTRCNEHLLAALAFGLPVNALITFMAATLTTSPLVITLTTSVLATAVSYARTYFVLTKQEQREEKLADMVTQ